MKQQSNDGKPSILTIGMGEKGRQAVDALASREAGYIFRYRLKFECLHTENNQLHGLADISQGTDLVIIVAALDEVCEPNADIVARQAREADAFVIGFWFGQKEMGRTDLETLRALTDCPLVIRDESPATLASAFWGLTGLLLWSDQVWYTEGSESRLQCDIHHVEWDGFRAMAKGRSLSFGEGRSGGNRSIGQALADSLSIPSLTNDKCRMPYGIMIHISPCSEITVADLNEMLAYLQKAYPNTPSCVFGFSDVNTQTGQFAQVKSLLIHT